MGLTCLMSLRLDVTTGVDMRKISHFQLLLPLLLTSSLCLGTKIEIIVYDHGEQLNWTNARLYCQHHHTDLVTKDIMDTDQLRKLLGSSSFFWIGLHRDPDKDLVWKWINAKTGEGLSEEDVIKANSWVPFIGKPEGDCGSFHTENDKWYSLDCSLELRFICYDDNLVVVNENKTWEDALDHCREMTTPSHQYDLLSVTSPLYYSYIRDKIYRATTDEVWTGLRFLGGEWWWMDGEKVDHQDQLADCPTLWKHCGVLSRSTSDNWITKDCSEKRNFICHRKEVK